MRTLKTTSPSGSWEEYRPIWLSFFVLFVNNRSTLVPSLTNAHLPGVVTSVDLLFTNKTKKDSQIGLYSSHEPLGEVVFNVRIRIHSTDVKLKPGLIGEVFFPFTK